MSTMRPRLFPGENDDGAGRLTTPPRLSSRKFGTSLSVNSLSAPRSQRSGAKKLVKVRRTPSAMLKSTSLPSQSPTRSSLDKTIVFSPGPVGLQLEPIKEDPNYGCRVVRFVDGGPKNPGQARKSGKMKPGDLVMQVESSGKIATVYKEIIQILKDSCATRTLIFRSVWESSFLDSQSKLNHICLEPGTSISKQHVDRPATPNAHNLTSVKKKVIIPNPNSHGLVQMLPKPFPVIGSSIYPTPRRAQKHENLMDIMLIQSPSQIALLPHVRTRSKRSMSRQRQEKQEADGPMIIHLSSDPEMKKELNSFSSPSPPTVCNAALTPRSSPIVQMLSVPRTLNYGITANERGEAPASDTSPSYTGTPRSSSQNRWNNTETSFTDEDSSIISTPAKLSDSVEQSQLFSPSDVKKLSKRAAVADSGHHALLSRVFGTVYNSIAPVVANSSCAVGSIQSVAACTIGPVTSLSYGVGGKIGDAISCASTPQYVRQTKSKVLQELSCAKIAIDVQDIAHQELERSMNELAHEKALMRADFEAKLEGTRLQHTVAEKELKELYCTTCKRQDDKIRNLQASNERLKREAEEAQSHAKERLRGMESEDLIHLQGILELTRSQFASKAEELVALQSKDEALQSELLHLQTEFERIQEREHTLQMELGMSRTMTSEMEQRMVHLESPTASSMEKFTRIIQGKEHEIEVQKLHVSILSTEQVDLNGHIDNLESGIGELQTVNKELKHELDKTRTELLESRDEVATMHGTLLDKLENGECRAHGKNELSTNESGIVEVSKELDASREKIRRIECQLRTCQCALLAGLMQSQSQSENTLVYPDSKDMEMGLAEATQRLEEFPDIVEAKNTGLDVNDALVVSLEKENETLGAETSKLKQEMQMKNIELETQSKQLTENLAALEKANGASGKLRVHLQLIHRALVKLEGERAETISCAALGCNVDNESCQNPSPEELKQVNANADKEIRNWQDRFKESANEAITTKSRVFSLRRENKVVNAALMSAKDAMVNIEEKSVHLENELKSTAEELAHAWSKLQRLEEEKKCDEAFLHGSEETLSQAVNVIKSLESDIAKKEGHLQSAISRIDELTENENILAAKSVCLSEKLLDLEGKLTSSTEDVCALRKTTALLESNKTGMETNLKKELDTVMREKEQHFLDSNLMKQSLIKAENDLRKSQIRADDLEASSLILESDMASVVERVGEELEAKKNVLEREQAQLLTMQASCQALVSHALEETNRREFLENKMLILQKKLVEAEEKHSVHDAEVKKMSESHVWQLQNLESSAKQTTSENENLRKAVVSAAIEIDSLQKQLEQLEASQVEKFSTFQEEKKAMVENICMLENQVQSSNRQLSISKNQVEEMKTTILIVETERDSVFSMMRDSLERADMCCRNERKFADESTSLKVSLRHARERLCILEVAIEGNTRTSLQEETQKHGLILELERKRTEIHALTNRIKSLQSVMTKTVQTCDDKRKVMDRHFFALKKSILALKAEAATRYLKCRDLEHAGNAKDDELSSLRSRLAEAQSNLVNTEKCLNDSKAMHRNITQEFESSDQKLQVLVFEREEENSALQESCHLKNVEIHRLRRTTVELEHVLENQKAAFMIERDHLARLSQNLVKELASFKRDVEICTEKSLEDEEQLKQKVECMESHIDRLQRMLVIARASLEESEENGCKLAEENKTLVCRIGKLLARKTFEEAARVGLRRHSDNLKRELEKHEIEASVLNSRVQATQLRLERAVATCEEHAQQLDRNETTNSAIGSLLEDQHREIQVLTKEKVAAKNEISTLRGRMERLGEVMKVNHGRLDLEKDALVVASSALENTLKSKLGELTAYQDQTKELKSKISDVETERDRVNGLLSEALGRSKSIDKKNCRLAEEVEKLDKTNRLQSDQVRYLLSTKCVMGAAMEGLRRKSTGIEEESTMMKIESETKAKEMFRLSSSIERVRSEMIEAQELSSKYQHEIQILESENRAMKEIVSQREQGNDKLVQEVFAAAIEIDSLRTASVENEARMDEERKILMTNIDDLEKELKSVELQVVDTQEETEAMTLSIEVIETERNSIRHALHTVEERAKMFEREAKKVIEENTVISRCSESLQEQLKRALAQRCFEATAREGLKLGFTKLEGRYFELIAQLEERNMDIFSLKSHIAIATDRARGICEKEYESQLLQLRKLVSTLRAECVLRHIQSRQLKKEGTRSLGNERTEAETQTNSEDTLAENKMYRSSQNEHCDHVSEDRISSPHLQSLKSAFKSQKQVLANLSASEGLFTDFMKEISILGRGAQGETEELLGLLDKCKSSIHPTSHLSALDLASAPCAISCIEKLRARLSRQGALARDAVQELSVRQREFEKWQKSRVQPPKTPIGLYSATHAIGKISLQHDVPFDVAALLHEKMLTPFAQTSRRLDACSSLRQPLTAMLLQEESGNYLSSCRVHDINDEGVVRKLDLSMSEPIVDVHHTSTKAENDRTKQAGVRLLSTVLEQRSRAEKSTAFRKWSCASSAMRAASNQKQASAELSLQLESTRKKLMILKAHLKKGRQHDLRGKDKKPRLRKLLNAVTEQRRPNFDAEYK